VDEYLAAIRRGAQESHKVTQLVQAWQPAAAIPPRPAGSPRPVRSSAVRPPGEHRMTRWVNDVVHSPRPAGAFLGSGPAQPADSVPARPVRPAPSADDTMHRRAPKYRPEGPEAVRSSPKVMNVADGSHGARTIEAERDDRMNAVDGLPVKRKAVGGQRDRDGAPHVRRVLRNQRSEGEISRVMTSVNPPRGRWTVTERGGGDQRGAQGGLHGQHGPGERTGMRGTPGGACECRKGQSSPKNTAMPRPWGEPVPAGTT